MTRDIATLGRFAADLELADIPDRVVDTLKVTLLHDLGMGLAGHRLAGPALALARAEAASGGPARILVSGESVSTDTAVLNHAAMIHARTQDDTQLSMQTHLGSTVLATLLALGEEIGASGEQLVTAMLAGYEVASHLGRGVAVTSTARGLRASSIYGPLGAAAGCAKLLGGSAEQITHAIALAAAFGGGTAQTWLSGTDEWQFQMGAAGRSGLLAARLACEGVRGSADAMTGASGFYAAFCGGPPEPDDAEPGRPWLITDVTYKRFPVCAINQLPIEQVVALRDARPFAASDVERVDLHLAPDWAAYPGTDGQPPLDGVGAALMSAPVCLAIALVHGDVTRTALEDHADPQVTRLAARVTVRPDPQVAVGDSRVVVTLASGTVLDSAVDGSVAPFGWTFPEVAALLAGMGDEIALPPSGLRALIAAIGHVERIAMRDLVGAAIAARDRDAV